MTALGHSDFLQALGWAVLNSLWQMALLWIVYNVALTLSSSIRSSQKSKWAAGLLITGFLWFCLTFISIFINKESHHPLIAVNAFSSNANESLNNWLEQTLPYASVLYIALLIIPAIRFVRNYRYVQLLRNNELSKISVEWRMFVKKVASQIGITKPVHVWVSNLISSPVTIGYLKPIILVPLAAVANLTPHQMEAVLLHELAHIRRHDYLVNLIINCIQTVLYFNPFVKAFVQTIERERETSCDEMVIQFQYDPHNYASALLMLEKNSIHARQMAMAASGKSDLLNRIERILNIEKKSAFSFNKMAGLFAGLLCVIILNALVIVGNPVAENNGFAFEKLGTPGYFFSDDENMKIADDKSNSEKAEGDQPAIENHAADLSLENTAAAIESASHSEEEFFGNANKSNLFTAVNDVEKVMPELSKAELKQVAITLQATKEVMEKAQWKEIEKNIADALTSLEKENVKEKYLQDLEKVNWKGLEEKLKLSYDDLNWENINDKLNSAIVNIKLDSLENLYMAAGEKLDAMENEVAIPASPCPAAVALPNIAVKNIQENKEVIRVNLQKVRAVRDRKIIHL